MTTGACSYLNTFADHALEHYREECEAFSGIHVVTTRHESERSCLSLRLYTQAIVNNTKSVWHVPCAVTNDQTADRLVASQAVEQSAMHVAPCPAQLVAIRREGSEWYEAY